MRKKFLIDVSQEIWYLGEPYYLRIRTQNENAPVVLFLHGGPGSPDRAMIMKYHPTLADCCTVVCWDQRGAGAAYRFKGAKKENLTKERYISDVHHVVSYLKKRFHKEKIILVGHSFGTQLAVWLLERHSEDVAVYVGIAQFVDSILNEDVSYQFTLDEAKKRNDQKAIKVLSEIGPPIKGIYKDNKIMAQRKYLHRYGGSKYGSNKGVVGENLPVVPSILKEYGIIGSIRYIKGLTHVLYSPLTESRDHFLDTVKQLDVPVYLMLGRHDYNCPAQLAEKWLAQLEAPQKKLFWFEKSAHTPQDEQAEEWEKIFREEILKKFGC